MCGGLKTNRPADPGKRWSLHAIANGVASPGEDGLTNDAVAMRRIHHTAEAGS